MGHFGNKDLENKEKQTISCPNCDCEVEVTSNENQELFCYCSKEEKTYKVKFCAINGCPTLLHADVEPNCCYTHDPGAYL